MTTIILSDSQVEYDRLVERLYSSPTSETTGYSGESLTTGILDALVGKGTYRLYLCKKQLSDLRQSMALVGGTGNLIYHNDPFNRHTYMPGGVTIHVINARKINGGADYLGLALLLDDSIVEVISSVNGTPLTDIIQHAISADKMRKS